jgi:hypothetical protein
LSVFIFAGAYPPEPSVDVIASTRTVVPPGCTERGKEAEVTGAQELGDQSLGVIPLTVRTWTSPDIGYPEVQLFA